MLDLNIPKTSATPEVILDPRQGLLALRGESYPENVLAFYAPILQQVAALLERANLPSLRVEMHITYYNSASAKAIHRIFQLLNQAGERGCAIQLLWHFDEEDDMARDLGYNLRDDFPAIDFMERPLVVA